MLVDRRSGVPEGRGGVPSPGVDCRRMGIRRRPRGCYRAGHGRRGLKESAEAPWDVLRADIGTVLAVNNKSYADRLARSR